MLAGKVPLEQVCGEKDFPAVFALVGPLQVGVALVVDLLEVARLVGAEVDDLVAEVAADRGLHLGADPEVGVVGRGVLEVVHGDLVDEEVLLAGELRGADVALVGLPEIGAEARLDVAEVVHGDGRRVVRGHLFAVGAVKLDTSVCGGVR